MTQPSEPPDHRPIYFDHHATTPVDARVLEAMLPFFTERFGNAHSADHRLGWEAQEAVETARRQVAALVGARPREIVFTSGATEANNLALLGTRGTGRRHRVASTIEHASVLGCLTRERRRGGPVTLVPVPPDGVVRAERLADALRPDTGLLSVMAANHEIGTLQPIAAVGELARARGILFHTDAAQAAGKIPIDVAALGVDLMSLSAHKLYGPKGVGALFVADRARSLIEPLTFGGGQEHGLRSGTLPVPLIVGFGRAAELALHEMPIEQLRLRQLRDRLLSRLRERPGLAVHGSMASRLAGNLHVGWPDLPAVDLLDSLRDAVAISAGSACASAETKPSAVLKAIGLDDHAARTGLRIGLGRATSLSDVERAADAILQAAAELSAG